MVRLLALLVLKEEEENQPLYRFLEHALIWIDTRAQIANAHMFILICQRKECCIKSS